MGFNQKDPRQRVQVSLNSFSDKAKDVAKSVGRDVAGAAGVAAGAAVGAAKNVFHHAKGATRFANSDLKHNMQNKSGRAIDN